MAAYHTDSSSDYEDLRTPDNLVVTTDPFNPFAPEDRDSSSSSNSIADVNPTVPPPIDPDEVLFDRNEWFVVDAQSGKQRHPRQQEYLHLLLENPRYRSYVTWLDKDNGLFTILLPKKVAHLWGQVKQRQTHKEMDYAKFSRGLRSYYDKGLLIKTYKKYTFCFAQPAYDRLT